MKALIETFSNYLELTKPKVTLLNLLVGITCFVIAAFPSLDLIRLATFVFVGYLTAGGCGALNCFLDKDIDGLMKRTKERAIPSQRVSPRKALMFGLLLTAVGMIVATIAFNVLTTSMLVLGLFFYIVVYTMWLKRSSRLNVVIGGAAGCFAGLSGWTAASGTLTLLPFLIVLLDFLWTPGHLWGLAMLRVDEYRNAGVAMLPVKSGFRKTALTTFSFNLATIGSSFLLPALGLTGALYAAVASAAGLTFGVNNCRLLAHPSGEQGFRTFLTSIPYLAIIMIALMVDKAILTQLSWHF